MSYKSKLAASLTPYVAGEQPHGSRIIKLNANENAYPPSPKAAEVIRNFDANSLRLYPKADSDELREAAAEVNGLQMENVFCANGSDEALAIAFQAFFDSVRFCDVTYSFYPVWAKLYGLDTEIVPLKDDFSLDADAFAGAKGAVIANPNAPTGILESLETIRKIANSMDGILILDEAYAAFSPRTAETLLAELDNLVIVRTFSKSHALAGLRASYVLSSAENIETMRMVKDSFNSFPLDSIAQKAAAAALRDTDYTNETISRIVSTREQTAMKLKELGFDVLPSSTNFLFAAPPMDAGELMRELKNQGIYVRYFNAPRTRNHLRITIGTEDELREFIDAAAEIIRKNK